MEGWCTVAARLTDRQKKKILADYVQLGSYNATAKINGCSLNTVKKLVQENADMAYEAFDLAEKYRHPVIVASDAAIGQMVEAVELKEFKEHDINTYDWAVRGRKDDEPKRTAENVYYAMGADNYKEYLSLQCDGALRNIVRIYPYDTAPDIDTTGDGKADEGSLRGSSEIVAARIRDEIQKKVADAGLEIIEARITYLAYAPEIAAVMLQRQQASAIIDARKMIVDGAVGMVEMALDQLNEKGVVELDEERKAAMVSNLLVVLCGNHDTQPIINSGSLY